jgi:hypothetical protein
MTDDALPWFDARATVSLTRLDADGTPASEVTACERGAKLVPVLVLRGPERLSIAEPAELLVRLPILPGPAPSRSPSRSSTYDALGPGLLRAGDALWLRAPTSSAVKGKLVIRAVVPIGADVDHPETYRRARERPLDAAVDGSLMAVDGSLVARCPACGVHFSIRDRWRWTGARHRTCGQRLRLIGADGALSPVWCVVGNIVAERPYGPGGAEVRAGTAHFAPGAKVYCFPPLWGDGYENIRVVGRHRGSHRWVTMIVRSAWITSWRAKLVYSPSVLDRLSGFWDETEASKERAQAIADDMRPPVSLVRPR